MDVEQNSTFDCESFFHKYFGLLPDEDTFLAKCSQRCYTMGLFVLVTYCYQLTQLMEMTSDCDTFGLILDLIAVSIVVMKTVLGISYRTYILTIILIDVVVPVLQNSLPMKGITIDTMHTAPWFQIIFVLQSLICVSNTLCCISTDCYLITFICQLCKEFELIEYSIANLSRCDKRNLANIINRHAIALDYGQIICNTWRLSILMQHLLATMYICFGSIGVLYVQDSVVVIKLAITTVIFLFALLLNCCIGETIISCSSKIACAIENSNYENYLNDVSALKSVIFLLCRAQKPLRFPFAWNSNINLKFFTETVNKLISCFVFLKSQTQSSITHYSVKNK